MQIFISYAREDAASAKRLFNALSRLPEVEPWLDEERLLPGVAWEEEILRAMEESQFVILVHSKHTLTKEGFVQREIAQAIERFQRLPPGKVFLITARIDAAVPAHEALKKRHYCDLYKGWDAGVAQLAKAIRSAGPKKSSLQERLDEFEELSPGSVALIQSHPSGDAVLRDLHALRSSRDYPRRMSVSGSKAHNPVYTSALEDKLLSPDLILGSPRLIVMDLYLIKALAPDGQPRLLQYYSGTRSSGWQSWLFPHGAGFQRDVVDPDERHRINAADFDIFAGLPSGTSSMRYADGGDYAVSIKPDFGYGHELVAYCFLFCECKLRLQQGDVALTSEFVVPQGRYRRRFGWRAFESLRDDPRASVVNADVLKAIQATYGSSLLRLPASVGYPLRPARRSTLSPPAAG